MDRGPLLYEPRLLLHLQPASEFSSRGGVIDSLYHHQSTFIHQTTNNLYYLHQFSIHHTEQRKHHPHAPIDRSIDTAHREARKHVGGGRRQPAAEPERIQLPLLHLQHHPSSAARRASPPPGPPPALPLPQHRHRRRGGRGGQQRRGRPAGDHRPRPDDEEQGVGAALQGQEAGLRAGAREGGPPPRRRQPQAQEAVQTAQSADGRAHPASAADRHASAHHHPAQKNLLRHSVLAFHLRHRTCHRSASSI